MNYSFPTVTDPAVRARTVAKLDEYIAKGQKRALATQQRVLRDVPTDYISPTERMSFVPSETGVDMSIIHGTDVVRRGLHRHGLGQVAALADVPMAYVDHLLGKGAWGRELLARNLRDGVQLGNAGSRYLVRESAGQVRGVLSSKFRRLDSRPILDMLIGEAQRANAIVVDGTASDIRTEVKFILPRVLEPAPGELMVFGFAWGTSDYGAGANWIRSFACRLWCLNGATMEQNLRQVHVGRQLTDDVAWSQRTLEMDTKLAVSATRDVARHMLSDAKIDSTAGAITAASKEGIDPKAAMAGLKKKITAGTQAKIVEAFNSADVEQLPPGNTLWRFSNAISLVARNTDDADQKLELERLAGDVLPKAA